MTTRSRLADARGGDRVEELQHREAVVAVRVHRVADQGQLEVQVSKPALRRLPRQPAAGPGDGADLLQAIDEQLTLIEETRLAIVEPPERIQVPPERDRSRSQLKPAE